MNEPVQKLTDAEILMMAVFMATATVLFINNLIELFKDIKKKNKKDDNGSV